jgi:ATP-binding cassette, subfamily B, bacterial
VNLAQVSLLRVLRAARPSPVRVAAVAVLSVITALTQAVVLILIVQSSVALAEGSGQFLLDLGPTISTEIAVRRALLLGGVLLVVVFVATALLSRLGATAARQAVEEARLRHLGRFLRTAGPLQQAVGSARFQELITVYTVRLGNSVVAIVSVVVCLLNLAILLASALILDPVAAGGVVAGAILMAGISQPLSRRRRHHAGRQSETGLAYAQEVAQVYRASQEIRALRVVNQALEGLSRAGTEPARSFAALTFLNRFTPSAFQFGGFGLLLLALALLSTRPSESIGELGSAFLLILRSFAYAQGLQVALNSLTEYGPYVEALERESAAWTAEANGDGRDRPGHVESIAFNKVAFRYPAAPRDVFSDLSFTIKRGEMFAIAGPSGRGKSTIASLLLRIQQPTQGNIQLNDCPIESYRLDEYLSLIGFVPQDPVLIPGSVADNVRFLRDLPEADVHRALLQAGLGNELGGPLAMESPLLDRDGRGVSGGQRQRLAIARALATSPEVIILDEPTSALDAAGRQRVIRTLTALRGKVILIVISHDREMLAACDKVLELPAP